MPQTPARGIGSTVLYQQMVDSPQLKQSLATSQQALRQYEWIQTTAVTVKGEQKAQIMEKCYYGMDGKVQKVPGIVIMSSL